LILFAEEGIEMQWPNKGQSYCCRYYYCYYHGSRSCSRSDQDFTCVWLGVFLPSISLILTCAKRSAAGTDGLGGMRLTCGTTLAGRKDRLGREGKARWTSTRFQRFSHEHGLLKPSISSLNVNLHPSFLLTGLINHLLFLQCIAVLTDEQFT
jgi:hypothetical protein